MRILAIGTVASLLILGCQKKSNKSPSEAIPSPSAKTAIDAAPQAKKDAAPEGLSDAELDAFITELFDRDVVAYSAEAKGVLYCDSYHFEGDGMTTVYLRKEGKDAEDVVEFQIGYDEYDDQRASAVKVVGAILRKDKYLRLKKYDWGDGDGDGEEDDGEFRVQSIDRVLTWDKLTLSIAKPGQKPVKLSDYEVSEPHVPGASAVFAGAGVPVVVVEITYDPGSEYIDGYTVNRQLKVFAIP
jgi:hypothetical protein